MLRSHCWLLLLLPLLGSFVSAQQPPPDKKDPQSTYEPRSGPGAGQKFLEKFVGNWEVVKTFHPRNGDPVRLKGECRQTMIHEGRFLKSEFTFQNEQGQTTGTGTIGFDPATGLFTSVWIDSRSTRMSFRQSKDKFNGEEIVLHSRMLDEGSKETRHSHTVTRLEDNGNKIVHRQFNHAADGAERLMMEIAMTRKAEAPPARR